MSYPNFNIEKKIGGTVIGIDEVGRGPLAGPVVSCACIFFDYSIEQSRLSLFDDSKKLTIKKRSEAFHKVIQLKRVDNLKQIYESDFERREEYRKKSITSEGVDGLICGFGSLSYILAIEAINKLIYTE